MSSYLYGLSPRYSLFLVGRKVLAWVLCGVSPRSYSQSESLSRRLWVSYLRSSPHWVCL